VTDIPQYVDELDELEDIYFGKKHISDKKELAKLSGLYKYCWLFNMPSKPGDHVPYNLLTFLTKLAPENSEIGFVMEKLQTYGYGKEGLSDDLKRRISYAFNWSKDFIEITERTVDLSKEEGHAVDDLIKALQTEIDEDGIQSAVFNVARNNNIKPGKFFKIIYRILIGSPQGPRLGPYVLAMGRKNVIDALKRAGNR
jgi:lysyl-tRNA synthetase class 1